MEVILIAEVPALGQAGEIVTVKNGYARNYLLPQKKAVVKSKQSLAILEKQKEEFEAIIKKNNEIYTTIIDKVNQIKQINITVQTSDATKIFGSVTSKSISDILSKEHKLQIDKKFIIIKQPIKSLGKHLALIQLNKKFQTELIINLVAQEKLNIAPRNQDSDKDKSKDADSKIKAPTKSTSKVEEKPSKSIAKKESKS